MGSSTSTSKSSGGGNKTYGMGPGQSMAMAGNTGLATATTKQAETIQKGTGKSFKAIGQNIGEVGSKYRRPADIDKYADKVRMMNEGLEKGGKIFVGADGVERVSLMGTGVKDAQGRTVLSITKPELTAKAPTLRQLGGDIARGVLGYNTLKYLDGSNQATMVREKGLIEMTPGMAIFNAIRGNSFFTNRDEKRSEPSNEVTNLPESGIRENERKLKIEKRLAALGNTTTDNTRPFLTIKRQGFGGTMS
tara:strand:+ start:542 stop:1288 length:747 start_codon:yes stop_codon:yes gene_type:complete